MAASREIVRALMAARRPNCRARDDGLSPHMREFKRLLAEQLAERGVDLETILEQTPVRRELLGGPIVTEAGEIDYFPLPERSRRNGSA